MNPESSLGRRFEEVVSWAPQQIAVRTPLAGISYGELNRQANRIAHRLLRDGGHPEESIAVLMESGIDFMAAMLGVLKAGRLLLPLDPTYPQERLASMLSDSGARRVICGREHELVAAGLLGNSEGVVNVNALPADLPDDNPSVAVPPEALAYLLYSSGSTGRPKGIVQPHRNVLQNARNYSQALGLVPDDRLIMLHSCSFSSGMVDAFCTLLNGATLYPWNIKTDGLGALGKWLQDERITIFNWSPTTYRHLLETLGAGVTLPAVRVVMLGSEPVTRLDWELYCRHFAPECIFMNRLGTTETNNFRLNPLNRHSEVPRGVLPAGYAVPDKEVLILDENEQPVPAGEVGQIAVRSRYLSPGYWKRPELTAAAFRSEPQGGDCRIYLTGDVGRLRPDGCLEYLGRKDSQIKFHGVRIEAAEIELALTQHPGVRDALVMVQTDERQHQCLTAYVIPRQQTAPSSAELHGVLSAKLPPAMVPSAFVFLEVFPMTPSGKVDRKALPAPQSRVAGRVPYVAPASATETALAKIWEALLQVDAVGRNDHFFNLGGHSLTAVQMLARVAAIGRTQVPLRLLFESPTLAGFAAQIDAFEWLRASPAGNDTAVLREEGVL